jgi:hypothetical protein
MSENIPALIARIEKRLDSTGYAPWKDDVIPLLDALSAVVASPGDEDTIKALLRALAGYDLHPTQKDQIMTDILAMGFRRLSPLTQEALARALYAEYRARIPGTLTWENDSKADEFRASAARLLPLLSRFALPEPAEDEWETCPVCQGTAGYWTDECRPCCYCKGRGRLPVEKGAEQ